MCFSSHKIICTPQKFNIDTKNGHIWSRSHHFQGPSFWGPPAVSFRGCMEEILTTWDIENPVDNGINYQPQLVNAGCRYSYWLPFFLLVLSDTKIPWHILRSRLSWPDAFTKIQDQWHTSYITQQIRGLLTHRIHGTGIFTYMTGWFGW